MWKKLTDVHIVDEVEPCVAFWTERFGFRKILETPLGDKVGYAALVRDQVEIHYRSRASLVGEIEGLAAYPLQDSSLITIEMPSVEEVIPQLAGIDVIIARRRTFYGNNEVVIRAPGGQIVIFTAPGNEPTMMVANPFSKQT
jgi:hypothetical protein